MEILASPLYFTCLNVPIGQVEDFWSLYNHVSLASNLPPGSDYSFFKVGIPDSRINLQYFFVFIKYNLHQEGIFPDWEDEKNGPGGRWIINSDKWVSTRDFRLSLMFWYLLQLLFYFSSYFFLQDNSSMIPGNSAAMFLTRTGWKSSYFLLENRQRCIFLNSIVF